MSFCAANTANLTNKCEATRRGRIVHIATYPIVMWMFTLLYIAAASKMISFVEKVNETEADIVECPEKVPLVSLVGKAFKRRGRYDDYDDAYVMSERLWTPEESFRFVFGVLSTTGSDFLTASFSGIFILLLLVFTGIPLMLAHLEMLGEPVLKLVNRTFIVIEGNNKLQDLVQQCEICRKCHPYDPNGCPIQQAHIHVGGQNMQQFDAQSICPEKPLLIYKDKLGPNKEPEVPPEDPPNPDEAHPFRAALIALMYFSFYWIITMVLTNALQKFESSTTWQILLMFATAGDLVFLSKSFIELFILGIWVIFGIAILSVYFTLASRVWIGLATSAALKMERPFC